MKITFFRSALNSKGDAYKAPLVSVAVPLHVPEAQAVDTAIKEFQEHMQIHHWQELAEFYEIT